MKNCSICKKDYDDTDEQSEFVQAGEWLSGEIWQDAGQLCSSCLENRARLAMMYCHEYNR